MTTPAPVAAPEFVAAVDAYEEAVARFQKGELPLDQFKPFRATHGVYEQRRDGTFMVRARVPGGLLGRSQALAIADIASELGSGFVHLTTRQDVQFHDISLAGTVQVMRRLLAIGIGCAGSGGNTVRNVLVCPFAGVCPRERFDVRPMVEALNQLLPALVAPFKLPRKFKIAVSGCDCDCAMAAFTDLGFVARPRNNQAAFAVYAGGGMGMHSRVAELLEETVAPTEAGTVTLALLRLFDRHGDRQNRAKARLRFAFDRLGLDAVRTEYLADKAASAVPMAIAPTPLLKPEAAAGAPPPWRRERPEAGLRVVSQRQPDHVAVALHPPLGLLKVADLRIIAEAAATFSTSQDLCLTPAQGLLLLNVPRQHLSALAGALTQLTPDVRLPSAFRCLTVCTSADTCRLGACQSRELARALAAALDAAALPAEQLDALDIRISGCGNSCGQSPVGDIGLVGTNRSVDGVTRPHYKLLRGARRGFPNPGFGTETQVLDAAAVPAAILALTTAPASA